ncbi:hypothetical protein CVT24_001420 [Panaeolus cyanescens]|uniref:Uncharacterized protein n=1 Tax=Panaeolus cyanescens TaxID=181874 RepID=A0A409WIU1_9AGAR|nr:hypothetical protein CVT24_001420 [Panaeolus cyanescens]
MDPLPTTWEPLPHVQIQCMSIEGYSPLLSNVQDFTLNPIATAADIVLNELEPLLSGDGSLEKHVDVLQQIVGMVAKAVTYSWAVGVHFALGLHSICDRLERWDSDEVTASATISIFVWLTKQLRYAKANAMDAKEQYEAAKRDAEPLFRQYLEEFGPDKVVQLVTKQKYDEHLNFQKVPLKTITDNVISKLGQCIEFTGQCIRMLQEIDAILVSFLEDEELSAGQPLNTIPIWSTYPYEVWGVLYGSVEGSEFEVFSHVMRNHSRLFDWIPDIGRGMDRIEEGEKEREAYVFAPEVRLHVPEDPEKYPLPVDILETRIGNAGNAILKVASVEYLTDRTSRMEFSVELPSPLPSGLENVSLICYPPNNYSDDDGPSIRFIALNSSGILDSPASKRKFGLNRAPRLKMSFTQTRSELKVERRLWGSIPTRFSVFLDAEYEDVAQMVAKAVTYYWAVGVHIPLAVHHLCTGLARWDSDEPEHSPSDIIDDFIWLTMKLRYAQANARDAQGMYEAAKAKAEPLFIRHLEEFGPDKVVQLVTKRESGGHLNFQQVPLKTITDNVMSKLEQCIIFTSQCIRMLEEIDGILVSFLGDEELSADQPLNTIPIWSIHPVEVWGILYGNTHETEFEFSSVMQNHSRWFDWIPDSASRHARLGVDRKAREAHILAPEVRLHIPKEPDKNPLPVDILETSIGKAGDAILKVASVEYVTDKISRMEFSVELPSAIPSGLEFISLTCCPFNSDSPGVRFISLNSSGILDSPPSKRRFGLNRAPRLKTIFTQTRSELRVERRLWGSIPTRFSVLLDAEYAGSCLLQFVFCFILDSKHCLRENTRVRIPKAKKNPNSVHA